MTPPPRISIVVPFYNRRGDVRPCLRSLVRQKTSVPLEIIAVDNGSTDGTREELLLFQSTCPTPPIPLIVTEETEPGPAAARNAGARLARGEWLLFIDSDCLAHGLVAQEVLAAIEGNPGALAVGGRIIARSLDTGIETFSENYGVLRQSRFFCGIGGTPPYFATACCAVRRAAFEQIGGFDPTICYAEDADLCWRLLDRGGTLVYAPRAVVRHRHRKTFSGLHHQAKGYGRAYVDLFAKHRERLGRRVEVDWMAWFGLAMMPFLALFDLATQRGSFQRRFRLYEAVWLAGYLAGRIRRSIERRVICC